MFRESLQRMVDRLSGGVAGILIGFDGISVESYTKEAEDGEEGEEGEEGEGLDIQVAGMELAHAVAQMRKAVERLDVGGLGELTLKADKLVVLVYVLSDEYFVACAVKPEANFGKARYLMRLLAPQLQAEL
jgi:predicted regulator of Ras-like GTPase activity (Roadblock/LC7/MglB family)